MRGPFLHEKIRDSLVSLSDSDLVDLQLILLEWFSPPRIFRHELVPMTLPDCQFHCDQASSSKTVNDAKSPFPAEMFIDLIIFHLWEQDVALPAGTWRELMKFYEESNFNDRCGCQIPLETLFTMSKTDANDLFRRKHYSIQYTKDEYFDKRFFGVMVSAFARKDPAYAVAVADLSLSTKIKSFLRQESITAALHYCLNQVIFGTLGEKVAKKRKYDPTMDKRELEKRWIAQNIDAMNIYVTKHFATLKGVTLTDGILINVGGILNRSVSEKLYDADLLGLACHLASKFLLRAFVGNYNFSTPTKDINGERTAFRMDPAIKEKTLEIGRFVETVLFGGIQPDWFLAMDEAAKIFMERASSKLTCPPALIEASEHGKLNLMQRPASISSAAELITEQIFLE